MKTKIAAVELPPLVITFDSKLEILALQHLVNLADEKEHSETNINMLLYEIETQDASIDHLTKEQRTEIEDAITAFREGLRSLCMLNMKL